MYIIFVGRPSSGRVAGGSDDDSDDNNADSNDESSIGSARATEGLRLNADLPCTWKEIEEEESEIGCIFTRIGLLYASL